MSEHGRKRRGPILWLADTWRADRTRVIVWGLFVLIVGFLVQLVVPSYIRWQVLHSFGP